VPVAGVPRNPDSDGGVAPTNGKQDPSACHPRKLIVFPSTTVTGALWGISVHEKIVTKRRESMSMIMAKAY